MFYKGMLLLCALFMAAGASASNVEPAETDGGSFQALVKEYRHASKQRAGNRTESASHQESCNTHNSCGAGSFCIADTDYYYGNPTNYCGPCPLCYWGMPSVSGSCPPQCSYASSCAALKPFARHNSYLVDDYDDDYEDVGYLNEYHLASCSKFETKSNQWCATHGPSIPASCWASTIEDCCETDTNAVADAVARVEIIASDASNAVARVEEIAIAGVVVGLVIIVALIVALSAWLCKCCCFRTKASNVVGPQQPVQMQVPQVIVIPSAPQ